MDIKKRKQAFALYVLCSYSLEPILQIPPRPSEHAHALGHRAGSTMIVKGNRDTSCKHSSVGSFFHVDHIFPLKLCKGLSYLCLCFAISEL